MGRCCVETLSRWNFGGDSFDTTNRSQNIFKSQRRQATVCLGHKIALVALIPFIRRSWPSFPLFPAVSWLTQVFGDFSHKNTLFRTFGRRKTRFSKIPPQNRKNRVFSLVSCGKPQLGKNARTSNAPRTPPHDPRTPPARPLHSLHAPCTPPARPPHVFSEQRKFSVEKGDFSEKLGLRRLFPQTSDNFHVFL